MYLSSFELSACGALVPLSLILQEAASISAQSLSVLSLSIFSDGRQMVQQLGNTGRNFYEMFAKEAHRAAVPSDRASAYQLCTAVTRYCSLPIASIL